VLDLLIDDTHLDLLTADPDPDLPPFLDIRLLEGEVNGPQETTALSVVTAAVEEKLPMVNRGLAVVEEVLAEPEGDGLPPVWGALLRRVLIQTGGVSAATDLFLALFTFMYWLWT